MVLLRSKAFVRAAQKFISKHPQAAADIQEALRLLSNDPVDSRLKTHKLKGELKGSLACSAGYDCRIVFSIVQRDGQDAILLETIGTHEEVY
jgi:mRNA-degrading endonuclease YafQ of YafQ-DinJ toxin-antitoxin module